jgi:hypothetical protein
MQSIIPNAPQPDDSGCDDRRWSGRPRLPESRQRLPRRLPRLAVVVVVLASVAALAGSRAATAGASPAPAAPDSVVSVTDPGVTLAAPLDGRLRGDGFAGQVLGVADGTVDAGAGLAALRGQRLWVFQLRFTVEVDSDGNPLDPISAAVVAGGDRYPFNIPVPSPADPDAASVDTGPLTFVASVPSSVPDVVVEVSAFGYRQDFSLTRMAREGVQPAALYRDPANPQTVQPLTAQTTLAVPAASSVVLGGNVAIDTLTLTVAADQAALSWFPPNATSQLPTPGSAWLYLDLSQTSTVTDSDCPSDCPALSFTSSLTAGQVTLTVPGAPPRASTVLPGTATDATDGTILQGVYAWQVPATLTLATVVVTPGTVTIDDTSGGIVPGALFPVVVPGTVTIPVDFPTPTPPTPPSSASDTPAVFTAPAPVPALRTSPTTGPAAAGQKASSSSEPGHGSGAATGVGVAVVAVAVLFTVVIIARRRRARAHIATPPPVSPIRPPPPVVPPDRSAGWPAPPSGFPVPPTGDHGPPADVDRNVDFNVDWNVDRAAHKPDPGVTAHRPASRTRRSWPPPCRARPVWLSGFWVPRGCPVGRRHRPIMSARSPRSPSIWPATRTARYRSR